IGQRPYAAVIPIPISIERRCANTFHPRPRRQCSADDRRGILIAADFHFGGEILVACAGRHERLAGGVVGHLHVDVLVASEYRQARALGGTADVASNPQLPPLLPNFFCLQPVHGTTTATITSQRRPRPRRPCRPCGGSAPRQTEFPCPGKAREAGRP